MARKSLKVGNLLLDLENPRISKASGQREALQKIIEDQDVKLVTLAESIVQDGLNPMDRLLVIKSKEESDKFIVIEGNRRLAAIKLLNNSAVLTGLEVRPPVQKRLESLANEFDLKNVEPIDCFEVAERADGAMWIQQRHTGENEGRGIVDWSGVARARFRGRDPALQALDLVVLHGGLSEEEKGKVEDLFPISTLDRLLSTPAVRAKIGVEIDDEKLKTSLPPDEVMKPLRRIVLDLANQTVNVTQLKKKEQQVEYVSKLNKDLPNLSKKSGKPKAVDTLEEDDFKPAQTPPKPKPKPTTPVRKTLIPKDCRLKVTNSKIAEISKELRALTLIDYPHSISVLFRVFLETSVDHYLTSAGVSLFEKTSGGNKDKKLRKKVEDAIKNMVANGVPKRNLDGVSKGINDKNSPLFVDILHNYVHNRFFSPTERDLKVAWDNAQPFFERIWS
jgi:hypothetical protein